MIPSETSKDIWFEKQEAEAFGTVVIRITNIIPNDENTTVECYDRRGCNLLDRQRDNVLTFQISSREEIYQQYSVIVALFFSIIAMVLSIINAIASIISLFR